jgi:hypothetical protein
VTEITQIGIDQSTYLSDDESSSRIACIIQVIFDQHLQVDVETNGGTIFEDVFVRPLADDFVFLNKQHLSGGSDSVKGSVLVPVGQISSIRFREDRDYVMTQPR